MESIRIIRDESLQIYSLLELIVMCSCYIVIVIHVVVIVSLC